MWSLPFWLNQESKRGWDETGSFDLVPLFERRSGLYSYDNLSLFPKGKNFGSLSLEECQNLNASQYFFYRRNNVILSATSNE